MTQKNVYGTSSNGVKIRMKGPSNFETEEIENSEENKKGAFKKFHVFV